LNLLPTLPSFAATKIQMPQKLQARRKAWTAPIKRSVFMADDMDKNRQSGQQGQQGGQFGQQGNQSGQQSGQTGQQQPNKKGGQGQNEEDERDRQRRAS
jgi:hypothetical protein